jgi:VCBS repeat protein/FG-GAP repeat protein
MSTTRWGRATGNSDGLREPRHGQAAGPMAFGRADHGPVMCALLVLAALCASHPASAQYTQLGDKLVGSGAVDSGCGCGVQQGFSVAVSADGKTAITGGPHDNSDAGAAWVFTRSGGIMAQQGAKLVGTGAVGSAEQGTAVALSGDGNTAIVGGSADDSNIGAAWVFTRSGGVWTQQGSKLVASDSTGTAFQGLSVALSADGNTAVVGGPQDNSGTGAAWVFTRSGGVRTQQGTKLVGNDAVGAAQQGFSVALSADGNTAIMGGPDDNGQDGAAWVFTRSGGVWTQQGSKLVGTFGCCAAQGVSVALSADGNTAVVGGPNDHAGIGAAWVFTRSGGVWTQQGSKLVGTGRIGPPAQGQSVALSADGNTAVVGGPNDNGSFGSSIGAVWVFTRSGGVWSQFGSKLVGSGAVDGAAQGVSVALSGDRRTILIGGPTDNGNAGATWVFVPAVSHDVNADSRSDIAWRDATGNAALSEMNGTLITAGPVFGPIATNWSIVGQRDFNGDGRSDLLWRDTNGSVAVWLLNGFQVLQASGLATISTDWSIVGTADFNRDAKGDVLWRNTSTGQVAIWLMNGTTISGGAAVGTATTDWVIAGTGDFDGDGMGDILWRNSNTGQGAIWFMNGTAVLPSSGALPAVTTDWLIVGTGDFNGDGKSDILWRNATSGQVAIWFMDGTTILFARGLSIMPTAWTIAETGDFDGDGNSDILWRNNTTGTVLIWFMNGPQAMFGTVGDIALSWTIQGANAD